jgi:hypothetical protein
MVTSGTASMQRASSFRELCVFPSLRAATDMAGPGGSAAVERYSRPAAQCGSAQHRRSQGRRPGTPVRPRLYGRAELPTAKSARRGPSRRGPPSRASPVPPRNPDLAQPRDPPGRTSPATQRLVMLRIAGRDRITKSGRHRWPSTEPPLPYMGGYAGGRQGTLAIAGRSAALRPAQHVGSRLHIYASQS